MEQGLCQRSPFMCKVAEFANYLDFKQGPVDQACKTFKTSCQQEFPWKISFQIFQIFLEPIPLLNEKLIRFGPLFHKNPTFLHSLDNA